MRTSNYTTSTGDELTIMMIEPDLWELKCDKGLCSGSYNGYMAASWGAQIISLDGEHLIDQLTGVLTPHEIIKHCGHLWPRSDEDGS